MPFGQFSNPAFGQYFPQFQMPDPSMQYQVDPGVDGTQIDPSTQPPAPATGFSGLLQRIGGPEYLMNLGAGILAGSRSGQGLAPIVGNALIGAQAARQKSIDDQLQRVLLNAKIKQANQETKANIVPTVDPATGKIVYTPASEAAGKEAAQLGNQAKPSALIEAYQTAKEQGYKGSLLEFQADLSKAAVGAAYNTTVTNIAGVPTAVTTDKTGRNPTTQTPLSSADIEAEVQRRLAEERAKGTATGSAQGQAQIDLPNAQAKAQLAIKNIDDLLSSKGLSAITGAASLLPVVPGTSQADADALAKNLQGRTFLEAVQALKGTGQITEIEGTKAEAAVARLQRSQSTGAYKAALRDLRSTISDAVNRKASTASGSSNQPAQSGSNRVRVDANGDVVQ